MPGVRSCRKAHRAGSLAISSTRRRSARGCTHYPLHLDFWRMARLLLRTLHRWIHGRFAACNYNSPISANSSSEPCMYFVVVLRRSDHSTTYLVPVHILFRDSPIIQRRTDGRRCWCRLLVALGRHLADAIIGQSGVCCFCGDCIGSAAISSPLRCIVGAADFGTYRRRRRCKHRCDLFSRRMKMNWGVPIAGLAVMERRVLSHCERAKILLTFHRRLYYESFGLASRSFVPRH